MSVEDEFNAEILKHHRRHMKQTALKYLFWMLLFIFAVLIGSCAGTASASGLSNNEDLDYLAEAIYFEARGEPLAGQYAVAQNIMNRVDSSAFPNSVKEVVHQRVKRNGVYICQYSYWCDGKPEVMSDYRSMVTAYQVASQVLYNDVPDITEGSTFFFNPNKVSPVWAESMAHVVTIGNHSFYRGE